MSDASRELREPVEAAYAAINVGDIDTFLGLLSDELEFTSLIAEAEGVTFRGHEGARAWWRTVRGAFDEVSWEVLDIRGSGSRGVVNVRLSGKIGGVPVVQTLWQAIEMRDGKAIWWANLRGEREAIEALEQRERAARGAG